MNLDIDLELGLGTSSNISWLTLEKTSINKTDADKTCLVTICRNFFGALQVDLHISGGKESTCEDYGIGENFTGETGGDVGTWVNSAYETNYTTVTFAADSLTADVDLTIIDNPVLELDRDLTIYPYNPTTGIAVGTKTLTIVDDNVAQGNIIDVLPDALAATGETLSERITDYRTTPAANVIFKLTDGFYYLEGVDPVPHATYGITFWGNGTGTILKRTDNIYSRVKYIERMINSDSTYSDAQDSKPVAFVNLTFDGNILTGGWYLSLKTTYTILDGDYVKYYFADESGESVVVSSIKLQWATTPGPDDTTGPDFVYYITKGSTNADAWQNLKDKLDGLGYTVYSDDTVSGYWAIMWDSGERILDLPAYIPTGNKQSSTQLFAQCTSSCALTYISANGTTQGKVKTYYENCTLQNAQAGGGLVAGQNTNNYLYYTDQIGMFARRGVNVIGGNAIINMAQCNLDCLGIETSTKGYPASGNASVVANLTDVDCGQFTTYIDADNADSLATVITATRLTTQYAFQFSFKEDVSGLVANPSVFTDCDIKFGLNYQGLGLGDDTISYPLKLECVRTKFTGLKAYTGGYAPGAPTVRFKTGSYTPPGNQYVKYQGCEFIIDVDGATRYEAVSTGWNQPYTEGNTIYLEKDGTTLCTARRVDGQLLDAFIGRGSAGTGQNYIVTGIDMTNVKWLAYLRYSSEPWLLSVDGADCVFGDDMVGMLQNTDGIYDYPGNSKPNAQLRIVNCALSPLQATIETSTAWATALARIDRARPDLSAGSMRTISSESAPTTADKGLYFETPEVVYDEWQHGNDHYHCTGEGALTTWTLQ